MSLKLAIDYGNTLVKIGVFNEKHLVESRQFRNNDTHLLKEFIQNLMLGETTFIGSIISSVIELPEIVFTFLSDRMTIFQLSHKLNLPFKILYQTPDTLGNDRIALAAGVASKYPSNNTLVIDAGTCVTFDFIDNQNRYHGGAISPGINMRFKALNTFTGKLPLVKEIQESQLIGNNTVESIRSGVLNGIRAEMDGIISGYKEKYPDLRTIITGGDAIYFDKKLKNDIFALPNLVLIGLNEILDINIQN
jgi:type III pantothenate kinase